MRTWVGLWDEPNEGNWTDANDGKSVDFQAWYANFPDGDRIENCAMMSSLGKYNDLPCVRQVCSICDLPQNTVIEMRGNCLESNLDRR